MIQQTELDDNEKNDAGYYTPKNILNPAMYRLAEITRALSVVNMEIDNEKLANTPEKMSPINAPYYAPIETDDNIDVEIEEKNQIYKSPFDILKSHEDTIEKILLIILTCSVGLFLIILSFSWPE